MIKLSYSDEVLKAKKEGKSIVALESTIISHGMPYPQNVMVAKRCEELIRAEGATPATIAIIKGVIKIGLNDEELDYLGKTGRKVVKVSRRDIPYVVSQNLDGATTVAATMIFAEMAGIKIFATGGIGGVHRGAENTFDISADLDELAKTNVSVICAGAKAILDLPKTLEYLETKGVMVIGYKSDYLPCFYNSKSDYKVPLRLDTASEIAHFINTKDELGLSGGLLITNPIPSQYELDKEVMDKAIDEAIKEMDEKGIIGKEQTPFLLAKIVEITGGKSLEANINLVYNNVKLAAQIAKLLKK